MDTDRPLRLMIVSRVAVTSERHGELKGSEPVRLCVRRLAAACDTSVEIGVVLLSRPPKGAPFRPAMLRPSSSERRNSSPTDPLRECGGESGDGHPGPGDGQPLEICGRIVGAVLRIVPSRRVFSRLIGVGVYLPLSMSCNSSFPAL